ncbi:hypothetical protein BJX65DRAFT_270191 [Aspergillus insuetus]
MITGESVCWALCIWLMASRIFAQTCEPNHHALECPEATCTSKTEPKSPLFHILDSLPQDPSGAGFSHLGMDGVWRNYDGNRKVISYRALSPKEIEDVLDIMPDWMREQLGERLEGVDGRIVTDAEHLVNPAPELRPKFEDDGENRIMPDRKFGELKK